MSAEVEILGIGYPEVVIQLGPYELRLQDPVQAVRFVHDPNEESGIKMKKLRGS